MTCIEPVNPVCAGSAEFLLNSMKDQLAVDGVTKIIDASNLSKTEKENWKGIAEAAMLAKSLYKLNPSEKLKPGKDLKPEEVKRALETAEILLKKIGPSTMDKSAGDKRTCSESDFTGLLNRADRITIE